MAGRQPGAEEHQDVIPALSYSMSGAAARTNIPQTKLWAAARDEQLRTFRIGRSRRVSENALCDFIQALETKTIVIDAT
jgi:hypothetical protein